MAKRSKAKKTEPQALTFQLTVPPKPSKPPLGFRLEPVRISWKLVLQCVLIIATGLFIYWPTLDGGWLWDDDTYITNNPLLHDPARLWKAWFAPGSFIEYYPIEQSVQWLQWQLWGNDTLGYHLSNVILHLVSAFLVWHLLGKFGLKLAWLGGLLFAIHPVQVESVAWISELKNTLSLPPFLLAMIYWIDYEDHQRSRDYAMSLGLFLVAMLCKITMAPFPVMILLYSWWKRGQIGWGILRASAPFFLISVVLGVTTIEAGSSYFHQLRETHAGGSIGDFLNRLTLVGLSITFYFAKCMLPVNLLPIYPQWKIAPLSPELLLPWPILGGVFYYLWTKRQSWGRHALLGLGFFLMFLSPFLGFVSVSYMQFTWVMLHFLYLPLIGLIGLVVAAWEQIGNRLSRWNRICGIGLVAGMMILFALLSHAYAEIYESPESFWTYMLEHNPNAWMAHNDLGNAQFQSGRISEAIDQYEQAIEIKPDYMEAHVNLANALVQTGKVSEAILQYQQAVAITPDYAIAHDYLGNALSQAGRTSDAIDQYKLAIGIKPDYTGAYIDLGNALLQKGSLSEAISEYQQGLMINPDFAAAHNDLGCALEKSGRISEAIDQYEQALKIDPDFAVARKNMVYLQSSLKAAPTNN